MTDRIDKILILSPPKLKNTIFEKYCTPGSTHIPDKFIIPKRRLTMLEIMNQWKPCHTCALTSTECPDKKENIVMCVGDKVPLNSWEHATDRIITMKNNAVKMGKSLETAAKNCKDAAENFKKAFTNIHNCKWNTEPEDSIGDMRDYAVKSGYGIPRSLWRVGDIITRDGNDEQEIINMRSGDLIQCRCIKEPPVYEGSNPHEPWVTLGTINDYVIDRCSFVRPVNKNIKGRNNAEK